MIQLVFTPHGTAELLDGEHQLWASDTDADFAEEFPDEFLDPAQDEEIMDYLVERGTVGEDVEYSVIEQALTDEDDEGENDEE